MLLGKHLDKYYKKYFWLFAIAVVSLIAVDWIQLYIPELLGQIVDLFDDNYVPNDIIESVKIISLEVLGISLAMLLGRISFRVTLFRASTGIGLGLRQEMFEKAERLDVEYYHNQKIGTIMSWITTDTEEIQEFFGWGTVMLVDGIFLTILCVIKMLLLDPIISLLIFIPLVLIVIWGVLVEKLMTDRWLKRQAEFDKMYEFTQENFAGIRVIKAFVKETQQLLRFSKIARKNKEADINLGLLSVGLDMIIEIIIALVFALLIGFGGYAVYMTITGTELNIFGTTVSLDAPKLVKFISYFSSLIWPLIALGQVITMYSRAKASLGRIANFLDAPEVITDAKNAVELVNAKGKIEFKHLYFSYPGKTANYLKDITFTINPGEKIGIVGRIGSGKTTILNLISRLYNVDEGTLFIDDIDIMKIKKFSLHENVAVVPQENFLFSGTISDNIKFGSHHLSKNAVEVAAEFADVDKDIQNFADKYETFTGERGVSLSGGQKQRIAIARAFIKGAPIMIFDDSVSAVDIKTEETILNNINQLRVGLTTIVIASRISTVKKLDKILVLNEGEVEAFDTPKNLEKISPTYKKMIYLQRIEDEVSGGKAK